MKKYVIAAGLCLVAVAAYADTKISQMPSGGALIANDIIPILRGGANFQATYNPSASGVASWSGDGALFNNSLSTGAVTGSLSNQTANTIFSGPATGTATTPTFRPLVTADFPTSGVTPGTYTFSTLVVDGTGRITGASNGLAATAGTIGLVKPGTGMTVDGSGALNVTATGGAGSGTVNTGVTPDLSYYATSTTAVSDATGLQYNATTKGINLNGVNAHSLPDNGLDTTGVSIGSGALLAQTVTGANNTGIGVNALNLATTGTNNTAIGSNALSKILGESNLVAIGSGALQNFALGSSSTTSGNVAIGYQALNAETTGVGNTAIGFQALSAHNGGNGQATAIGYQAMASATNGIGVGNTAIGYQAGKTLGLNAANVTFIGNGAGSTNVNGIQDVCIGAASKCGGAGTTQDFVSIGYQAGNTGNGNVAIGSNALNSVTGTNNVGIGVLAGATNLQTGGSNVVIGNSANVAQAASAGVVAIGSSAKGGTNDVAIGNSALNSTSTNNLALVAIGYQAGFAGTAVTTGTNSTFIGYQAQSNSATGTNRTALGYQAIAVADNDVVLGNSSVATIHAAVTSITAISDRRAKKGIHDLPLGLDFITKLKPVAYRLKNSAQMEHFGFIAQDAEQALPVDYQDIIEKKSSKNQVALMQISNDKQGTYNMNYGELIAPLVKAVQEQQEEIDALKAFVGKDK